MTCFLFPKDKIKLENILCMSLSLEELEKDRADYEKFLAMIIYK